MDDSYSPTATWREGYYEGATEDGGRVLFFVPSERYFVPSKTNMIARFQVQLNLLITDSTQGDHASRNTFEAEDVGIVGGGGFLHSSEDGALLFGLHGVLGPNGEAWGRCIGVVNGGYDPCIVFGPSQWRRWEAVWKATEDDLNAPLFLP
jgi:hypothetical protein